MFISVEKERKMFISVGKERQRGLFLWRKKHYIHLSDLKSILFKTAKITAKVLSLWKTKSKELSDAPKTRGFFADSLRSKKDRAIKYFDAQN